MTSKQSAFAVYTIIAFSWISLSCSFSIPGFSTKPKTTQQVGFEDWIADAPEEIDEWKELTIQGTIPSEYARLPRLGTL